MIRVLDVQNVIEKSFDETGRFKNVTITEGGKALVVECDGKPKVGCVFLDGKLVMTILENEA